MTLALQTDEEPPSPTSRALTPRAFVNAGCSVPAAALTDRELAGWVRSRSVSVTARDDHDLDLVQYHNIRAVQVVYRCGTATTALRRAVALGVSRFVVSTPQHMARIAESAPSTRYLYLDDQAPLMLGDKRLKVIGLHTEVTDPESAAEWACAAQRLIGRSAVLKACGSTVKRIALSGGSTQLWLAPDASHASRIVGAVDQAVRDECQHWQLTRPAVTLAALTAV
ncbi:hypothetical protein [Mycolicibacterium baixiangningiae]|uniref:hypothetical protein n=1 Tax=Mycolicibacterium baixiangningiae TaxID=2761578 RepID=UPI001868E951|nr:hypothetical protein [Mycolicibacterium baixiangningiae]